MYYLWGGTKNMRRMLTKRKLRQLDLLEALFYSKNRELHENLITNQFNITERILKNDIDAIHTKIDYLHISKNDNYYALDIKNNYSIDKVYKDFLQESNGFRLLDYLFKNNKLGSEDLENKLFLSASSVYRIVDSLNKILEENYGVTLSTNPYQIIGDEYHIRYFFIKYYTEAYSIFEWPFEDIDEDKIKAICLFFLDLVSMEVDVYTLRQFSFEAAISIIRKKNGHPYNSDDRQSTAIFDQIKADEPELLKTFEAKFGFKLTLEFATNFGAIFANNSFNYSYDSLWNSVQEKPHDADALRHLKKLLAALQDAFDLPLKNEDELILELYNIVAIETRTNSKPYLIYPHYAAFDNQINNRFPDFHKEVKEGLNKYLLLLVGDYPKELLNAVISTFYLYWDQLFVYLEQIVEPIKTLVISDYNQRHAMVMKDMLEHEYATQLSVDIWESKDLSRENIASSEYELIVAGFSLENFEDKYCISLNNLPTINDFHDISEIINTIKKRASYEKDDLSDIRFI